MQQGGIDYAGLLRAALLPPALGGLGLLPAQFWALSPIEVQMMLGRGGGGAAMTQARLRELVGKFPDKVKDEVNDTSI